MAAFFWALFFPGAGQAYNGNVLRGFLLMLGSVLILPWMYSLFDAAFFARRNRISGIQTRRGGAGWALVQAWCSANFAFFILMILTLAGVTP